MNIKPPARPVLFAARIPGKNGILRRIASELEHAHGFSIERTKSGPELKKQLSSGKKFSAAVLELNEKTRETLSAIRVHSEKIPVILLTRNIPLPEKIAREIDACFEPEKHTPELLACRIAFHAEEYLKKELSIFFQLHPGSAENGALTRMRAGHIRFRRRPGHPAL